MSQYEKLLSEIASLAAEQESMAKALPADDGKDEEKIQAILEPLGKWQAVLKLDKAALKHISKAFSKTRRMIQLICPSSGECINFGKKINEINSDCVVIGSPNSPNC